MNKETLQNYNNRLEKNNVSLQDVLNEVNKLQEISLQDKTVIPSKTQQTITHDTGFNGLGAIIVEPIPDEYIVPSGTLDITENGTQDVTNYAEVNVNVEGTGGSSKYAPKGMIKFDENPETDLSYEVANLDTSNLTSMYKMFSNAKVAGVLDLRHWNTANVTNMSNMFYWAYGLTGILIDWDTSNVTTMQSMFEHLFKLEELDLSSFNTSNVQYMNNMFYYLT